MGARGTGRHLAHCGHLRRHRGVVDTGACRVGVATTWEVGLALGAISLQSIFPSNRQEARKKADVDPERDWMGEKRS